MQVNNLNNVINNDLNNVICKEDIKTYCKYLTEGSKNEKWFIYTALILNIAILVALTVFFDQLFGMSKSQTEKKCRNDNLQTDLNNILAAFFIVNVIVQLVNIIITATTNMYFGKLSNCDNLMTKQQQEETYNKKNKVYKISNIIRIILVFIVIGLLFAGIYIWGKCKQTRKHEQGDTNYWYPYFNNDGVGQIFTGTTTVNLLYKYPVDFNSDLTGDELINEYRDGIWIFSNEPQTEYIFESEFYDKNKTILYLESKYDTSKKLVLEYDYKDFENDDSKQIYTLIDVYNNKNWSHVYNKDVNTNV